MSVYPLLHRFQISKYARDSISSLSTGHRTVKNKYEETQRMEKYCEKIIVENKMENKNSYESRNEQFML